jgi:hypothetical protein
MSSACSKHGLGPAVGRSPANQIVSVPLAHALATKKLCFGLWPGLVLELPKSLAVTRIFFFMVYDGNYFNCSTLILGKKWMKYRNLYTNILFYIQSLGGFKILKTPQLLKVLCDEAPEDPNYAPPPEDRPGG